MGKIVECKFSSCIHDSRDIPIEDAIAIGRNYYHRDCAKIKSDIAEIIDIFAKEFNPNVVFSQLRRAIDTIIFNKGIDSGMLLFGVKYYAKNHMKLNYPGGLYYVIQNVNVEREWRKIKAKEIVGKQSADVETVEPKSFNYVEQRQKTITDLFGE